jgi:Tol biopolymer transport system component
MNKVLFQVIVIWTLWVASGRAESNALLSARLVNVPAQPCLTAGGPSYAPQFSPDGRHLYFVSSAANLTTNRKLNACLDLFRHELATRATTLISVGTNGTGGDADSFSPAISSNGQFIAFFSHARNLVSNEFTSSGFATTVGAAHKANVFLKDTVAGTTQWINRYPGGSVLPVLPSGSDCSRFFLSANAKAVAFESREFLPSTFNQVFWWHSQLPTNVLQVDLTTDFPFLADRAHSQLFALSAEGDRILLQTLSYYWGSDKVPMHLYLATMQPRLNANPSLNWLTENISAVVPGYLLCTNATMTPAADLVAYLVMTASNAPLATMIIQNPTNGWRQILSTNCLAQSALAISDDGHNLLVQEPEGHCLYEITNGYRTRLASPLQGSLYHPVLSGNGQRVAFYAADPTLSAAVGSEICHLIGYEVSTGRYWTILSNVFSAEELLSPPAISGDGQQIAFETPNAGLVTNDLNRGTDVFWMAAETGAVQCVSLADPSQPPAGSRGLIQPGKQVSSDGRRVAFVANDGNFVPGDTNGVSDLMVRDMAAQTNWLVSQDPPREGCFMMGVKSFMLSTNGERVAYLRPYQTNAQVAHLLVCREVGSGQVVTSFWAGSQFQSFALSPSGHRLAFSTADAVIPDFPAQTNAQVFLWDDQTCATRMISVSRTNGLPASQPCLATVFLPNEEAVLFITKARELYDNGYLWLDTYGLYRYNIASKYLTGVASGFSSPSAFPLTVTPNSRFVIWQNWDFLGAIDMKGTSSPEWLRSTYVAIDDTYSWLAYVMTGRVFLKNRQYQSVYECGRSTQTAPNGKPFVRPVMTSDGRFVAYADYSREFNRLQTNGIMQVRLYDHLLRNSIIVTEAFPADDTFRGGTTEPVFSGDNQTLTITTRPSEVAGAPLNQAMSLFQVSLVNADSDRDGLNDAWEMAFFGSLEQAASGDFDQDGMSNLQEQQAGTSPASGTSLLAATILVDPRTASSTLAWQATPGTAYRIEYKNGLQDLSWRVLESNLLARAQQAVYVDPNPVTNRFYRLLALP